MVNVLYSTFDLEEGGKIQFQGWDNSSDWPDNIFFTKYK